MLMRSIKLLAFIALLNLPFESKGQGAASYFHKSANMYIDGNNSAASNIIEEGLQKFPNDPKLTALKEKLKKEDKEKKDQEKKDQEKKDQEKKDQEKKDEQKKQDQEKKDQEQKDQEKKDGEKDEDQEKKDEQKDKEQEDGEKSEEKEKEQPKPSPSDKLKEMNISEEKAKMILEAMKNKEIQYIQQNRRKATKKKKSDKPDW